MANKGCLDSPGILPFQHLAVAVVFQANLERAIDFFLLAEETKARASQVKTFGAVFREECQWHIPKSEAISRSIGVRLHGTYNITLFRGIPLRLPSSK
jgi:hypothetical protein